MNKIDTAHTSEKKQGSEVFWIDKYYEQLFKT